MWLFRKFALAAVAAATIAGAAPRSQPAELPWAAIDSDYRAHIETHTDARCAFADLTLTVADGVLPEGLRIQGDAIAGIPKEMGIFRFRLRAANDCAASERDYRLQVTAKPVLRVSATGLAFEYRAGAPVPESKNVLVSSTWPDLAYSVNGETKWLRVSLRTGVTPRPGSAFAGDAATVEVIPQDLKPGVYETRLVFVAREGGTPPVVPVKLTVLPAQTAK